MTANVDQAELHKFSELAATWWDREGPMRPLHDLNPVRLEWIDRISTLAGKRVDGFSLGMGQRLGVAAALSWRHGGALAAVSTFEDGGQTAGLWG